MKKYSWLENFVSLINKDWLIYLVIAVISLFLIIRQGYGGFLLQGETGFHFFPLESFKKSLFMWLEIRNGCTSITHNMGELPIALFQMILYKLRIPLAVINRVSVFLIPFLFGVSAYYLTLALLGKEYKYIKFVGLFASILAIFDCSVFGLIFAGGIRQGIVIPLSIYFLSCFIRFFSNRLPRYLLYMLIISPFLNMSIAFFAPIVIPIILYFTLLIANKYRLKKSLISIIISIVIFILLNSWWIMPFLNNALKSGKSIIPFTVDIRQTTIHSQSTHNILRALTTKIGEPPGFMVYWLMSNRAFLLTIILIIFAFSSLLFSRFRKISIFLASCIVISAFFGAGSVLPYGYFYRLLFNKIPLFLMFRDPNKFTMYMPFYYSVLISIALICLVEKINLIKAAKKVKIAIKSFIIFIILLVSLMSSFPLVTGNMLGNLTPYMIPSDYYRIRDYLAEKSSSNVLILPFPQYYSHYTWHREEKYATTNLLIWFLSNPYIYNEFGENALKGMNPLYPLVWDSLWLASGNCKIDKLNALLNIDYIVLQKDQLLPCILSSRTVKEKFKILEKNVVREAEVHPLSPHSYYIDLYKTKNKGLHIYTN